MTTQSQFVSKIPPVGLAFWIMKICATTLGETAGDLLSMTLDVGYLAASVLLLSLFGATLTAQLLARRYRPAVYWAVILSTSTAGTTVSDFMDRTLHLGYLWGSCVLAALLVAVLATWRATTGSLAVEHLHTRRAELFYWLAILVSNTLGTALGDFLADSSGLGFAGGAALIGGALAVVVALAFLTSTSRVLLFWSAFILTRPFGATVGDLLTKSPAQHGLGLGTLGASAVLGTVLLALVVWSTWQQRAAAPGSDGAA